MGCTVWDVLYGVYCMRCNPWGVLYGMYCMGRTV